MWFDNDEEEAGDRDTRRFEYRVLTAGRGPGEARRGKSGLSQSRRGADEDAFEGTCCT